MSKSSSSQIITCKAAVIWGCGEPLKFEEIQIDPPKSTEVRVRMLYASVCHTDILRAQGKGNPLRAERSESEPKSLIHPCAKLPHVDEDGDAMMEVDEEVVEKLCIQVGLETEGLADEKYVSEGRSIIEQGTEDTDVDMEEAIHLQVENHEILILSCAKPARNVSESCEEPAGEKRFLSSSASKLITEESPNEMMVFGSSCIISGSEKGNSGVSATSEPSGSQNEIMNFVSPSSLSIVPSEVSLALKSPTPSVSPRISSNRKSLRASSMLNSKDKPGPKNMLIFFAKSNSYAALPTQTSKSCLAPTEHLASSLHHGLEIIDSHRKSSVFRRLSFRFASILAGSNPILPDLGEREVLLEEIQDLRSQLQYYTNSSSSSVLNRNSLLKLTYSCEPSLTWRRNQARCILLKIILFIFN